MLERTVALGPKRDETLDEIIAGDVIRADELPEAAEEERQPPS